MSMFTTVIISDKESIEESEYVQLPAGTPALDPATFQSLINEGQVLREEFDQATRSTRVLTAEDLKRTSR